LKTVLAGVVAVNSKVVGLAPGKVGQLVGVKIFTSPTRSHSNPVSRFSFLRIRNSSRFAEVLQLFTNMAGWSVWPEKNLHHNATRVTRLADCLLWALKKIQKWRTILGYFFLRL
jgi:hypothetical protein